MKRALLVLLVILPALLCACSQKETAPREEAPAAAQEELPSQEETTAAQQTDIEEPPEEEPAPVYDETPELSSMAITADGADFARVYEKEGALLLCLQDLADVMGGSCAADETACEVSFDEWTVRASKDGAELFPTGARVAGADAVTFDGEDWFVPARDLLMLTGRTEFLDAEQAHLYYTTIPDREDIPEGISIPVLMYHAVSDDMWGYWDLFVSPSDLEAHLQYLQDNGYTTVTFEDLPYVTAEDKPVMLTFDDGYDDNYTELFPILQKYNAKATVFCITGSIGNEHMLTEAQIREMSDSGLVSIQSHTVTHPYLGSSSLETVARECTQSRLALLRITGKLPFVLCYPSGSVSEVGIKTIAQYYDFGLLMNGGMFVTGADACRIPRFYVARGMGAGDIACYLTQG